MTPADPSKLSLGESGRGTTAAVAGLLLLGFLAYANSLRGPFVFDDLPSILENASIRHPSLWRAILWPPPESVSAAGRPLLNLSFAVNYAISGDAPWSYHLFNVFIHLGAGVALFGLMRRTLLSPRLRSRFGPRATLLAFLIAAGWLVHPLQTQAVTYVVQRAESLMGFFFLFMSYAFARGAEEKSRRWLAAAVIACVLGLATKEVMVVGPLLVLLYDRTFLAGSFRGAWEQRRPWYLALAATWLLLAALVLSTGGNRGGSIGLAVGVSPWAYGLTQFQALTHYLRLAGWPSPLVFEYGTVWTRGAREVLPPALVVLTLVGATVLGLAVRSPLGFAGAWFFGILAPTSLSPGTTQMIVEHRMYLPLAAVIAVIVLGIYAWRPRAVMVLAIALPAGLSLTLLRNEVYRSAITLWSETVAQRPENGRAHGNLAQALVAAGRPAEALDHYRIAARLMPDEPRFPYNSGVLLAGMGRMHEAIASYQTALRLDLANPNVQHNLALALAATGNVTQAAVHAALAVRLRPTDPDLHYSLAFHLLALNRPAEAIAEYQTALRLQPDFAAAETNLGNVLLQLGRLPEALIHYESAVQLTPNSPEAQGNLALAWLRQGRVAEAHAHFAQVLALAPKDPALLFNLGRHALELGQPAEAVPLLGGAIQLQPEAIDPRIYRAEALYKTGDLGGAAADYEAVLKIDPTHELARRNLATVRARLVH
jgi:tetratricopeptide (TPR) repeat protein